MMFIVLFQEWPGVLLQVKAHPLRHWTLKCDFNRKVQCFSLVVTHWWRESGRAWGISRKVFFFLYVIRLIVDIYRFVAGFLNIDDEGISDSETNLWTWFLWGTEDTQNAVLWIAYYGKLYGVNLCPSSHARNHHLCQHFYVKWYTITM